MRYILGSGIIGAVTSGISLLRGTRDAPVTWRAVLAWLSWGISLALSVGAMIDMNRSSRGVAVSVDSPEYAKQHKAAEKALKKRRG